MMLVEDSKNYESDDITLEMIDIIESVDIQLKKKERKKKNRLKNPTMKSKTDGELALVQ